MGSHLAQWTSQWNLLNSQSTARQLPGNPSLLDCSLTRTLMDVVSHLLQQLHNSVPQAVAGAASLRLRVHRGVACFQCRHSAGMMKHFLTQNWCVGAMRNFNHYGHFRHWSTATKNWNEMFLAVRRTCKQKSCSVLQKCWRPWPWRQGKVNVNKSKVIHCAPKE